MINPKITIIDYGIGNTYSVSNAIKHLGYNKVIISDNEDAIKKADALILPGVGAFEACINNLYFKNLVPLLSEVVLEQKKPILGICVGMQLLASYSEENGLHKGLNWIPGQVKKLKLPANLAVPHVGWNNVTSVNSNVLFDGNQAESNFYFDHSYSMECGEEYVAGFCDYGTKIIAAVQSGNIFGVQFHPEKSQTSGLKLFRSFFNSI